MFRLTSAIALSLLLASCTTGPVLRPMLDGYPGTPTHSSAAAQFQIPQGWRTAQYKHTGVGRYAITPDLPTSKGEKPLMTFLFSRLDPTAPATAAGQVESYLDAMRTKDDSTVRTIATSSIQNPQLGTIEYHTLQSSYSGYRFHAEIVTPPVGLNCQLVCKDAGQLAQHRPAFEAVLRSVRIKDAQR